MELKLVVNEAGVFKETLIKFKNSHPNRVYIRRSEAKERLEKGLDVIMETFSLEILRRKFPSAKEELVLFYYEKG